MIKPGVYNFSESFQLKVLALFWLDSSVYLMYNDIIQPKYFSNPIHVDLCRSIFDYYEKYKKSPTMDVLIEEAMEICESSKKKESIFKDYLECIDKMSKMDFYDEEYIKEKITSFGKRQALVDAVIKSASILEKEPETKYGDIEGIIKSALMVGENVCDLGTDLFENIEERFLSYLNEEDVIERISTNIEKLDDVLGGGLGRTELGVVVAAPGRGKSSTLVSIGAGAIENGYKVLHISLENNEKQVTRNYDVRLLKRNKGYVEDNTENSIQAMKNIKKYRKGRLKIKKYPTKSVTVKTIRILLNKLKLVHNFEPDVLIVDYGALLKPTEFYNDKRNSIESIFEELRAVADDYNLALWTAAQGNRGALSKRVVSMQDLAECFAIANIADVMACLCQTLKEKKSGILRMFLPKIRDNADTMMLSGAIQYDIKLITMDAIEEIPEESEESESSEEKPGKPKKSKHYKESDTWEN